MEKGNDFLLAPFSFLWISEWSATYIADYNSGKYYYIEGDLASAYDIYDYETGELVSKATTTPEQIENDAKEILGVD